MKEAVIYARVSSKEQELEGFSIPAQLKFLREYACKNEFHVAQEFIDVETAKVTGRKRFGEMLAFLSRNPRCRILIVEKTDRLYRNFRDCVALEEMDVEIHLPKEGQIISKEAKSQAKLMHGIQVVIARNYIENLKEEVKKGMREKAEQGIYPSRPPIGYQNNKLEHTIEVDPRKAPIVCRMFDLYASGKHSSASVRTAVKDEFGIDLAKGYINKVLKNPFFKGQFWWDEKPYLGTHTPLVSPECFERVQAVIRGHNKPHFRSHNFAYRGLLTCAYDNCKVTAEIKKEKYTYYRCTFFRGKCDLPYFREEELGDRLAQIVKDIHISDTVLAQLQKSLLTDKSREEDARGQQRARLRNAWPRCIAGWIRPTKTSLTPRSARNFGRESRGWQTEETQVRASIRHWRRRGRKDCSSREILELAKRPFIR